MAAAVKKLSDRIKVNHFLSGDATTAKALGWVDMRDYGMILVTVLAAALTGTGTTVFKLVGSAVEAGTNPVDIVAHAVGSAPDAAGDFLVLEASAEQIAAAGTNIRYVSAWIDNNNASDNVVGTYVRSDPRFAKASLTADTVS